MSKAYDKVTEYFVNALNEGRVPWRKTWASVGIPKNLYSKRHYNGINVMVLGMTGEQWFATFRQAQLLGGSVRKGAKALPVVYWNFVDSKTETDASGKPRKVPFLRYSSVFPASALEGIDIPATEAREHRPIAEAEAIVARNKPEIVAGEPAYSPAHDCIKMPAPEAFEGEAEYYATLFHELTHWTGHRSRLDRDMSTMFGGESYSKEELVAEIGACLLANECGIEVNMDNSKGYIQGWASKLASDPRLIVCASSKAKKAMEYLTGAKAEATEEAEEAELATA